MSLVLALLAFCLCFADASAQLSTSGTGVVRHGVTLTGSNRVEGSLQILTGETSTFGGTAVVTGDLLVPGTPPIQFAGNPSYGGTLQGTGSAQPSSYSVTGNGHFSLRHVVVRTNPVPMPLVAPPPLPAGTRDVTLSNAGSSAGSFSTIRNLTVTGSAGNVVVPPGTYGAVAVNGNNSLTLGVPGATQPAVYNFQQLTFSGNNDLRIVGPVVITVNSGVTCGGRIGSSPNPAWLKLRLATGNLVLSGNNTIYGEVAVPNGSVQFNGNSELIGALACDRLVLNGNNLLRFLVLNTPPAASDQPVTTPEDIVAAIQLEGTDPDGSPLIYTVLTYPAHGTLRGEGSDFTYTPAPDYYGPDSLTFKVSDGQADSNVATVDITVTPVNDRPKADGQDLTTEEDVALPLILAGGDIEGDALSYRITSGPVHGTLEGTGAQLIYHPSPDSNGPDQFTFVVRDGQIDSAPATVTVDVGPINDPPEATNAPAETNEDVPVSIVLEGTDADGDSLTYRLVDLPSNGVLSGTAPNFSYKPRRDFHGTDAFTFRANDTLEDSDVGTITIVVHPINDPPTAAEQNLITTEDTELPIVLAADDVDGDPLSYTVVLAPTHGTLGGDPPNVTYVPEADYNGPDSFTFKTNDGQIDSAVATVGITVIGDPDEPTAAGQELETLEDTPLAIVLTGHDADGDPITFEYGLPEHGTLTGTPPALVYTPEADYSGPDSFTFSTNDGDRDSAPAEIRITVLPVPDAPTAQSQNVETQEDTAKSIVLAGQDADGDIIGYTILTGPTHGTLEGSTPNLLYKPEADYSGPDQFEFKITDSAGNFAVGRVSIDVIPVNDAPKVVTGPAQTISLPSGTTVSGTATDDGMPVGSSLSFFWTSVSGPATATFQAPQNLTTTVAFPTAGVYVLRLTATDSELSGSADVTITVQPENHAPVVNAGADQTSVLPQSVALHGIVTDDGNPAGRPLTVSWSDLSGPGPVTFADRNSAQTTAVFPVPGIYVLRLSASDTKLTRSDEVVITILPHNEAPLVSGGGNQSTAVGETLALPGTASDDGNPAGGQFAVSWSKLSGPGAVTFGNPTQAATTAQFSIAGEYTLRLSATDSELTSTSDIVVVVGPRINRPPTVNAGPDQTLTLYNVAVLNGTVTDDGLPGPTVTSSWTKVSGPGEVSFGDASATTSVAIFSQTGTYVLRFTASDSELSASDEVTITTSFTNHAPVVDAGPDQSGFVQNPVTLSGQVTDDGLPVGADLTVTWSKVSGPGAATFANASTGSTTVTFAEPGTYVLELKGNDSELTATDQVTVVISVPCSTPPSGLVGFWRGEGDAQDAAGTSHGLLVNTPAFSPGKVGNAFTLNGTNMVKVPASAVTDVGLGAGFTAEMWINPTNTAAQQPLLEWNNGSAIGVHFWISVFGQGTLFVNVIDTAGGAHYFNTPTGVITAGTFQHVAVTYDKTTGLAALYKNGQVVVQQHIGIFTPLTSYDVYLGHRPGSYFTGKLDEVSLYQRALRTDEIQSIYQAGAGGKCVETINRAPMVNAGNVETIPFGYALALKGTVSDDGRPAGATVTTTWSKVSGPGTVSFLDESVPTTTAAFSVAGTYVLRLSASDTDLTAKSDVTIQVLPAGQIVPPTVTITPYQAAEWRYKVYPYGTVPANVGNLDFDDSDYPLGRGAFGSGGGCAVQSTVHTAWPVNTEIVLRRFVDLPTNITNVRVSGTVDNDVQILINGVASSGFIVHEGCAQLDDTRINVTTSSIVPGRNLFVVRGRDRGAESFLDVQLLVDQPITANAGPDATVSGGAPVSLNGSGSTSFSGAPLSYQWTQVGGPAVPLDLTNPSRPAFVAPALAANTPLTFRLVVNDGRVTSSPDTVVITVLPSTVPNLAPTVNAGPDQTLQSSTATLSGSVQDDGRPSGAVLSTRWSVVSGAGTVNFTNANNAATSAQFSRPGVYLLRLTANDSQLQTADDLVITIPAGVNVAPTVNAGADRAVISGQSAALGAQVSDDGLPTGTLSFKWTQVSGPGFVTFANAFAQATAANFPVPGTYVVRVTASDSVLIGTDEVTITASLAANVAPTANAGPDQTISIHAAAILAPTADDDGLPAGVLYYRWSGVSGPGTIGFANTNGVITAAFSEPGHYVLRFMVSDSELATADDVTITVLPDNQAPVVSAGANQTVRLANTATLTGQVTDDGLPLGGNTVIAWSKVSGPGAVTFNNISNPVTTATFSEPGVYNLQLSASDGALSASNTTSVTVTSAANVAPVVSFTSPADGSRALVNTPVSLAAAASDTDGVVTKVSFYVNGLKQAEDTAPPYGFTWSGGPAGSYVFTAVATDNEGASTTGTTISLQVVDPGTAPPPNLELTSPADAAVITAPTQIHGTVEAVSLKSWRLEYQLQGSLCANWVTFATGTGEVHDNVLGTLDPTLLLNGTYSVRLVVTDLANVSRTTNYLTFFIDGNMKVGNFTATFKDLELPLSGVPITVTRTYDSRNKCPGDFGYGWTLDVDSIRLESTEQMGDAWSLFIFVGNPFEPSYYRLDDAGPHLVSLKMPDGQLFRFTPKLVMDRPYNRLASLVDPEGDDIGQVFAPIQDDQPIKMIYRARPGSEGAVLKARGYRTASIFGGLGTVSGDKQLYLADTFEGAISLATQPGRYGEAPAITGVTGWELTLRDGRVLLFDAEGKLEEMRDRAGNKVAFHRQGTSKIDRITHTPSGKEIVFTRDGANRIQSITDPAGNAVQYRYTSNGDLEAVFERGNDPANNAPTTRFTYKGVTHLLEDILDARGIRAAKNFYDDAGRLYKTIDAEGNETIFTHDLNNRTETIKDRAGNITVHKYDERGNVIETRAPDGTVTATDYHHWSDGKLSELKETESVTGFFTNEANPSGPLVSKTVTTTYSYEDNDPSTTAANDGLLRKMVDPKGNTTTFTYDGRGNILTVTDARANAAGGTPAASVVNTYNGNGLLETATDALGNITSYTYDAKGNPDKETRTVTLINADGSSNLVSVETDRDYNALGQLEKVTDPAGHATTYEYDANGNRRFERTTRTSTGATIAVVTETEYDEQDRPVRTWNADNPRDQATRPSSETVYDGNGKVEWTYDALGRGTHQEYNSRGLAFKTTHPDNAFETVTYDAEGRREIATDRRGKATRTVYDAMGRVSETIFVGGTGDATVTLSSTRYDAAGRVWQSIDANNNTTSYGYDDAGRRTAVSQPLLQNSTTPFTTRYSYDPNGNLRFVTDPKGLETEHVYDALNRRRQTILPAAALDLNGDGIIGSGEQAVVSSTSTSYDELGRRITETDASNRTKRFGYDVLGRLRHVIDYAGHATRFDYDELGNQLSQTDANNRTTRYTYDNAGRRVTRTLPLGQQELLDYDEAGNLETRKDFNGKTTTFQYDPMNRLRFKIPDASLAEPAVQFTYNDNGQRETMSDASGLTVYGYDGRGQLRTRQTPYGTLSYDYYSNGSLRQMWSSNANGINVSYGYDALNRLQTVSDANAGATSYGYDANGNLESVLYPNGVSHAYGYNPLNRLTGLNVSSATGTFGSFGYAATPAGQRTSVSEGSGRTAGYGYDNLGRLQRETITGSSDGKNGIATYGYDNVGNRLTRTSSIAGITNQNFGYDWNDRLNGDQYDNNGNTKSAPVSQPTTINPQQILGTDSYDSENRLVRRAGFNGSNIILIYDGDGNLVQELVDGQIKNYLVDDRNPTGYAQVVEEIVNGVVNHTYTYGHDLISQDQFDTTAVAWRASFYGYDGRGTVRFLTDETGAVTDTYTYDAFGTLITATGSTNNRYLYSGEQFDPNLGLYYLRARLMNPLTGRFWSMDSYEGAETDPVSLHKYLYANADPTNGNDPSGNLTLTEAIVTTWNVANIASSVGGAAWIGYRVGTLIDKISTGEIDDLSDAADEARDIGIDTLLTFGGLKFGGIVFSKITGTLAQLQILKLGSRANTLGRAAEVFIAGKYTAIRNTVAVANGKVPDFIGRSVVREVKNRYRISVNGQNQQLLKIAQWCAQQGKEFVIHVRPTTTNVENTVNQLRQRVPGLKVRWERDIPEALRVVK